MTRDEIVAIIKQRMGNYNDSTIDAHIVTEMKLNQTVMEQEPVLPWFLIEGATADQAASATYTEPLVLDRGGVNCAFLAEYEECNLGVYITADGITTQKYIQKDQYEDLWNADVEDQISLDDGGRPTRYSNAIANGLPGIYKVFPTPDEAYSINMLAYYADVPLDTDITNLWLTHAPDLVIAKVGLIIAGQYTMLEKFVPSFSGQIKEAQARLAKINTLKDEENIRRLMGDS